MGGVEVGNWLWEICNRVWKGGRLGGKNGGKG